MVENSNENGFLELSSAVRIKNLLFKGKEFRITPGNRSFAGSVTVLYEIHQDKCSFCRYKMLRANATESV